MSGGDSAGSITTLAPRRRRLHTGGGWAHGTAVSKSIAPLRSLARTTAQACAVNRCSLFVWCEGFLIPIMSQFASGERRDHLWRAFLSLGPYRMDEIPAFARAITERHAVIVSDTAGERGLPAQWAAKFGAASGLVVPLVRDTAIIGVALLDNGGNAMSREHIRRMRGLGPYLASVLDSTLSLTELRGWAAASPLALGAGHAAGATPELQDTVRRITRLYARAAEVALYAERVRVDNLLHDTLRQTLFGLGFRIEAELRRPQRASALRAFIRELKQLVALMMTQINQVIPTGSSPVAPWAELAEVEARIGLGLRDAVRQLPERVATRAHEHHGR